MATTSEEVLNTLLVFQQFTVEDKRSPRNPGRSTRGNESHRDTRDIMVRRLSDEVDVSGDSGLPSARGPVERQADIVNPGPVALCVLPRQVLSSMQAMKRGREEQVEALREIENAIADAGLHDWCPVAHMGRANVRKLRVDVSKEDDWVMWRRSGGDNS